MKMCENHWAMLKKAIDDRGMTHLVCRTGEEAAKHMKEEIEAATQNKEVDPNSYDPLLSCYWMITGMAVELGGLYLLSEPNLCPVCEAGNYYIGKPINPNDPQSPICTEEYNNRYWIEGPADSALLYCRNNGLIPMVQ